MGMLLKRHNKANVTTSADLNQSVEVVADEKVSFVIEKEDEDVTDEVLTFSSTDLEEKKPKKGGRPRKVR